MIGITRYGAYIPWQRLSRADIGKAWGVPAPSGEKAVASYDEDSLTMAVAAARDCIRGIDPKSIDGLYFASTTFPYKEKLNATTLAAALDIDRRAFAADFSGSLRSGANAMRAAIDAIKAGSARNVLVCAADMRLGHPNGEMETSLGDGAAAVIIGDTGVIATIEGSHTLYDEFIDVWRSDKDVFVRFWEDRFIRDKGYGRVVAEAVTTALSKYNLTAKDFSKVVFNAPDSRQLSTVAKTLGFDSKTQVQDPLYSEVGNTGTVLSMMCLVAALEQAKAGDRILVTSYGDGCDVFILKVTEEIKRLGSRRGVKAHLETKQVISYHKYLRWRELIDLEPPKRPPLDVPSAPALWRDTKGGLALYGVKCKRCGTPQYPAQRVCADCHTKDEFEDYCFADKIGEVSAFSHDALGVSLDPPITTTAVDFPEGGRIMCDMTDRNLPEVKVGMPVEMTFRKLRYSGGIYDYWWKCQPVRGEK